jgi:hypothetical protein
VSDSPILKFNQPIVEDGDMSGNVTSESINVSEIDLYCVQVVWSNGVGLDGTLTLEASLDDETYTTVNGSSLLVSGASDSIMYNVTNPGYIHVRLKYTSVAGTGTLNARIAGKDTD